MRATKTTKGLKVNAIAGTYVVVLGFDLPQKKCKNLLGFSILRKDETEGECYYLKGTKTFQLTDPGFPAGSQYSTKKHPIQGFQWADYSAKPDHTYTYTVTALKGTPSNLKKYIQTSVTVQTESTTVGKHNVLFNRGLAASQEYTRRFGDLSPDKVPNNKAYEWLSRGLYEGLEDYINSCKPGKHALRISAYEFNYKPFLQLLRDTIKRGVDIKIVFDARRKNPRVSNLKNIKAFKLTRNAIPRANGKSYISHNKFIVKLENGKPISVWTGGTNFSKGGIFGQSNVAHIFRYKQLAKDYFDYWLALSQDPSSKEIKKIVEDLTPLPTTIKKGSRGVFSPRKNLEALKYYKETALNAKHGLLMTFAFGINDLFKEVYEKSDADFRFALLEKMTRGMKKGPKKTAEVKAIKKLRYNKKNLFAIGSLIKTNEIDGWVKEKLTGLNHYVNYVHNKFMLVDPLTSNPIVITGSANFSNASTIRNDENMVVIKGNKAVADIYFGEFFRLYAHHAFRESLKWRKPGVKPKDLQTSDWWASHFGKSQKSNKRKYFARMEV